MPWSKYQHPDPGLTAKFLFFLRWLQNISSDEIVPDPEVSILSPNIPDIDRNRPVLGV